MKFSAALVSLLFSIASAKKHGLRNLKFHEELTTMGQVREECSEYFFEMDLDEDDVLSFDDLKTVVTYLIEDVGANEADVRQFADDLSATDSNNDGQIQKVEFMNACTNTNDETAQKMKNVDQAKKQFIQAARKKQAAIAQQQENLQSDCARTFAYWGNGAALGSTELINWLKSTGDLPEDVNADDTRFVQEFEAALSAEGITLPVTEAQFCSDDTTVQEKAKTHANTAAEKTTTTTPKYSQADIDECRGYFKKMDIDEDGVLSLQDLEVVIDSKVKSGNVDEAELRDFVDDMGNVDVNNDELIDVREFMSACLNN